MNREKLCVFCEHWRFNGGSPSYSVMTPGWNATMNCAEGRVVWELEDLHSEDQFRHEIERAKFCPAYKEASA